MTSPRNLVGTLRPSPDGYGAEGFKCPAGKVDEPHFLCDGLVPIFHGSGARALSAPGVEGVVGVGS